MINESKNHDERMKEQENYLRQLCEQEFESHNINEGENCNEDKRSEENVTFLDFNIKQELYGKTK